MLNKTNILVIFILFTIGCVNLPETTAEHIGESPTATIDIDATVMAMFEASNSKETVKKDPPADTQVNITSANAEQAVSVNLEATIEALRRGLLSVSEVESSDNDSVDVNTVIQDISPDNNLVNPTPTVVITPTPIPTLDNSLSLLPVLAEPSGAWYGRWNESWSSYNSVTEDNKRSNCYDISFTNTHDKPISAKIKYEVSDNSGIKWDGGEFSQVYVETEQQVLRKVCLDKHYSKLYTSEFVNQGLTLNAYMEAIQATEIHKVPVIDPYYAAFHWNHPNPGAYFVTVPDGVNWFNLVDYSNPYQDYIKLASQPDVFLEKTELLSRGNDQGTNLYTEIDNYCFMSGSPYCEVDIKKAHWEKAYGKDGDGPGTLEWKVTNSSPDIILWKVCLKSSWKSYDHYSVEDRKIVSGLTYTSDNLAHDVLHDGVQCTLRAIEAYSAATAAGYIPSSNLGGDIIELMGIWVAKID